MKRIFFAHPRHTDGFDDIVARLTRACKATDPKAELVTARADYLARANACGGWQPWQRSVSGSHMGEPRFDVIVVGDGSDNIAVAKGTYGLVEAALEAKRPVLWWNGDATFIRGYTFRRVVGQERLSGNDWKRFAKLVLQ